MLIDNVAERCGTRTGDRAEPTLRSLERHSQADLDLVALLERRFGRAYTRQRLGIERDHEVRMSAGGIRSLRADNWYSAPWLIRTALRVTGLYRRAQQNAARVLVRENVVRSPKIPSPFNGFRILHITDLHADISEGAMDRLADLLPDLDYDLCVLTGDYRGKTYGPFGATIEALTRLCPYLNAPVYGVLGNHDTIEMVPGLESLGIRLLLNANVPIQHRRGEIYLAGIDDAHFYQTHNIEKARAEIPDRAFSILLSHTPETYRHAAHAGFDLLLSGHTHGGQICLPRSIPITLDSVLPRQMGSGAWRYQEMLGYTSVGVGSSVLPARLNCPPEITLHRLERREPDR